ncbi:MAG: hypothetical protein VKJ24_17220 [Synechococcales bacterium]|nr:hypothetical protein [Synechococcales bacterium]
MFYFHQKLSTRSTVLILAGLIMGSPITGAIAAPSDTSSKAGQCNALLDANRQGEAFSQQFEAQSTAIGERIEQAKTLDEFQVVAQAAAEQFTTATEELEKYTQVIETVNLQDGKLITIRDRMVTHHRALGTELQKMAQTFQKLGSPATPPESIGTLAKELETDSKNMDVIEQKDKQLIQEFQAYCGF